MEEKNGRYGRHDPWNLSTINWSVNWNLVMALSSSLYPSIIGGNIQIYSAQITGKSICEPLFPFAWSNH